MAQNAAIQVKKSRITKKDLVTGGFGIVFLGALAVSGQHIYHVAIHYGQMWTEAGILPLILDVFGLFCAVRLRLPNISGIARTLARIGMWFALGTSLAINIEHALIRNTHLQGLDLAKAVFISAIAAIVVWVSAEILTHIRKAPAKTTRKPASKPSTAAKPTSPRTGRQRVVLAAEKASQAV